MDKYDERILLVASSACQISKLHEYADFFKDSYTNTIVENCLQARDLEQKILGTETPEDRSNWNLASLILYNGDILGYNHTVLDASTAIEETINSSKIDRYKIDT